MAIELWNEYMDAASEANRLKENRIHPDEVLFGRATAADAETAERNWRTACAHATSLRLRFEAENPAPSAHRDACEVAREYNRAAQANSIRCS